MAARIFSISIIALDNYIHRRFKASLLITESIKEASGKLFARTEDYYSRQLKLAREAVQAGKPLPFIEVSLDALRGLAEKWNVSDVNKFRAEFVDGNSVQYELPKGDAQKREIHVDEWAMSANLIDPERHSPVHKFAEVFVDEVTFYQLDKDSHKPTIAKGRYLRIQPPSGLPGAVVLPVDAKTGDVLLVTQFRHPQRKWLTEAPRGFGTLGIDRKAVDTAIRELGEETGTRPIIVETEGGIIKEEIYFLRALYTDTGKLTEAPNYFLAYVDREDRDEDFLRREPLMENPVWIRMPVFYDAVYKGVAKIQDGDYMKYANFDKYFSTLTDIDDGTLRIEDAFTALIALLAKPQLQERFPQHFRL